MSIDKKLNLDYNGTIPYISGDRFYPQDYVRDIWHIQDQLGLVFKDLAGQNNFIISGGIVTQGAATDELNISACVGYVKYQVEIPNTFAATPPSKMNADVETKRVASTVQTNLDVSGTWNNDNSTTNYVKLAYSETNGNTRDRAKAAGNYAYEKVPSFTITVDDVAPTAYEIELARFITEGGNMPEYFDYSGRTASIQDYITMSKLGELQRNALINPEFSVAQRGTSFTAATTPANNDDQVLLDRWILLSDGNDIVDVSQDTDAPTNSNYSCKSLVATINKKWGFLQIVENANAVSFEGKTVSLSFQAKTTAAKIINKIRAAVISWDGAADAPTTDIVNAWNASGTDPTLVANWTYENTPTDLVLTTSWKKFVIEDIDIDTASMKNFGVFIWVDDTDAALNDELFLGQIQLNLGSNVLPFQHREIEIEKTLCRKYFFSILGDAARVRYIDAGECHAANSGAIILTFPHEMRTNPTVTVSGAAHFNVTSSIGGNIATTGMTPSAASTSSKTARIDFTVAAGLAAGDATLMFMGNNASYFIFVDAEF